MMSPIGTSRLFGDTAETVAIGLGADIVWHWRWIDSVANDPPRHALNFGYRKNTAPVSVTDTRQIKLSLLLDGMLKIDDGRG